MTSICTGLVVTAAAQGTGTSPAAGGTQAGFTENVEVVGATPIHGLGIDRDRIPSNIQAAGIEGLQRTGGLATAEQIYLKLPSVHVNEATTNPFQPDLHFRGFVGSPLLGLPQGLAVYQNGVRLNEPFGDTINWDLLPANAVAAVNLMPGSNPLFGLNALGGALSVQTKTGFSSTAHRVSASGGSFGRYSVEAESGGNNGRVSYFAAATGLSEDGWRDASPSRLRQLFGDVEWRGGRTTVGASVTAGFNRLIGNGAAPIDLLDEDRSAIFTFPDETKSRMALVSLRVRHDAAPGVSLDATVFYRRARIDTFNGDDSDYDGCETPLPGEFLCAEEGEGELVLDQFGRSIGVGDGDLNGTNNTSQTVTDGWGGAIQGTIVRALAGRPNHFIAGATFDAGASRYDADTEIARLTEQRGTAGIGRFDQEAAVRLRSSVWHTGVYAANFFTVVPQVTVMAAARLNVSDVTLRDRAGSALDGDHSFSRVNPAAGVTYAFARDTTAYGSFSMSSRVPAPSELSCADPEDPCRLPNAFVADPPLEQVVAQTWEGGVRGGGSAFRWNASGFSTTNRDDIMFISSGPLTNTGHFQNIGDTVRRGVELSATGAVDQVRWGLGYTLVHARFDSPLTLSSPNHPAGTDGEIDVQAGSRIPGVPRHTLKANLSTTVRRLWVGSTLVTSSSQYLRGDEANLLPALDGFAVAHLSASYMLTRRLAVTGRVTNLFDASYETFGLLGEADDVLGDDYDDPRFLSPGAPRAAWLGISVGF